MKIPGRRRGVVDPAPASSDNDGPGVAAVAQGPQAANAPSPNVDPTVSAVESRLQEASRIAVTFVVGLAMGAGGVLGYQKVTSVLAELQPDPLAYVTVVDSGRPIAGYPLKAVQRLEVATKRQWRIAEFDNVGTLGGPPTLRRDRAALEALREHVLLPPLAPPPGRKISDVNAVVTNVLDQRSVARNGAFYMVHFIAPPSSTAWLLQKNAIFSDKTMDANKETFLAGVFVLYYAPPTSSTGTDWSKEIDVFAKQLLPCGSHGDPCPLPPEPTE